MKTKKIGQYHVNEVLHRDENKTMSRAQIPGSSLTYIIKALYPDTSDKNSVQQIERENKLRQSLQHPNIQSVVELIYPNGGVALVQEDFFSPLSEQVDLQSMTLGTVLDIATQLVAGVAYIHSKGIIHKDLNLTNLLIDPETSTIKITGFDNASAFEQEFMDPIPVNELPGILAYLAPEQTGWINQAIDTRSDIYSIGIILYELLCGCRPFQSTDSRALIQAHLTEKPPSFCDQNPECPPLLESIVLKCLEKAPENRYQSANGLLSDLSRIKEALIQGGSVSEFSLADTDISDRFRMTSQLFGRSDAIHDVQDSFLNVKSETSVIFISGESGVGKTRFSGELARLFIQNGWTSIIGRCEPSRVSIPLDSLHSAISQLIHRIVIDSEMDMSEIKADLTEHLGTNLPILTRLIPEIELIIGNTATSVELECDEIQNRLNFTMTELLKVLCTSRHPLVILLEDMQWADTLTYNLIRHLMLHPDIPHLGIICTFRPESITLNHPLSKLFDHCRIYTVEPKIIQMENLNAEETSWLIADTLKTTPEQSRLLAERVFQFTAGNPFDMHQLFHFCYQQKLIHLEPSGQWRWDESGIFDLIRAKTPEELYVSRLEKISKNKMTLLTAASGLGVDFDLKELEGILNLSSKQISELCLTLSEEGYIVSRVQRFGFAHNQIHSRFYNAMTAEEQAELHYRIGQYYLKSIPEHKLESRIFDVVNHLNLGIDHTKTKEEQLLELNIRAADATMGIAAFSSAYIYLRRALQLLDRMNNPELKQKHRFNLLSRLAAAEFSAGKIEHAELYVTEAMNEATDRSQRNFVERTQVHFYSTFRQYEQSIAIAIRGLQRFNISLSAHPTKIASFLGSSGLRMRLFRKSANHIMNQSVLESETDRQIFDLLRGLLNCAYMSGNYALLSSVIRTIIKRSLKFGLMSETALAFAGYAWEFTLKRNYKKASRYYQLSQALLTKNSDIRNEPVLNYFYANIGIWTEKPEKYISYLEKSHARSREVGDSAFEKFSDIDLLWPKSYIGENLKTLEFLSQKSARALSRGKNRNLWYLPKLVARSAKVLLDPAESSNLNGDGFSEAECVESGSPEVALVYYSFKIQILYLFDNGPAAIKMIKRALPLSGASKSPFILIPFYVYSILAIIRALPNMRRPSRRFYSYILHQILIKRFKDCIRVKPELYSHFINLIQAELAQSHGHFRQASANYDKALEQAKKLGYPNHIALIAELATKFYWKQDQVHLAKPFFNDAVYYYSKWGCQSKVTRINQQFPILFEPVAIPYRPALDYHPDEAVRQLMDKTVLVCDDDEFNRAFTEMILDGKVRYELAQSGKEVLAYTRKSRFDLILLDIQMPGMDGVQTLQELRDQGVKDPVIALTGESNPEDKARFIKEGFSDFLPKPFRSEELMSILSHYLEPTKPG